MKKFLTLVICLLSAFAFIMDSNADKVTTTQAQNKVTVYIFTKQECPYCEKAKTFLTDLLGDENYKDMFQVKEYQVWGASWEIQEKNKTIMDSVGKYFGVEVTGAPYIVIGTDYNVNGFSDEISKAVKKAIKDAYKSDKYTDLVSAVVNNNGKLPKEFREDNTVASIIGVSIIVLLIGGFTALIIFSRKEK